MGLKDLLSFDQLFAAWNCLHFLCPTTSAPVAAGVGGSKFGRSKTDRSNEQFHVAIDMLAILPWRRRDRSELSMSSLCAVSEISENESARSIKPRNLLPHSPRSISTPQSLAALAQLWKVASPHQLMVAPRPPPSEASHNLPVCTHGTQVVAESASPGVVRFAERSFIHTFAAIAPLSHCPAERVAGSPSSPVSHSSASGAHTAHFLARALP